METLLNLDRAAALAVNGLSGGASIDAAVGVLTGAGHGIVAFFLTLPILLRRNTAGRWAAIVACVVGLTIGGLAVQGLKRVAPRPRPAADAVIQEKLNDLSGGLRAKSFPSGHAQTAFGAATVVLLEAGPVAGAAAFVLAVLVGLSRVYLGAHFPSDVVAGALLGVVIAWLAVYSARRWMPEKRS